MSLVEIIQNDMKQAMRDKNKEKLSTLRMLLATIEKKKVEKKLKLVTELAESDIIDSISKNVKQLDQEIESLINAGRDVASQLAEKKVLSEYLPKQMTIDEITKEVSAIVKLVKSAGGNMGVAMKEASAKMKGKADMKLVSQLVKEGMK